MKAVLIEGYMEKEYIRTHCRLFLQLPGWSIFCAGGAAGTT